MTAGSKPMPTSDAGREGFTPPRRGRDRMFLGVVLLALVALSPLVAIRLQWTSMTPEPLRGFLMALDAALSDIRFGGGLRFWLGVAGTALMVLPLIYPIRKLRGFSRLVGVGAWFNLHVLSGVVGPLLILYHCSLGPGSKPANVALGTMLVVVLSGLVGHFVFTRVSGRYYGLRAKAALRLEDVMTALRVVEPGPSRDRFIDELQRFHGRDAAPSIAPPSAPDLLARAQWLATTQPLVPGARRSADIPQRLAAYFAAVAKADRWQGRERLWRGWRLLHLPVFAIMVMATTIHVSRVWDLEPPAVKAPALEAVPTPSPTPLPSSVPTDRVARAGSEAASKTSPVAVRGIRTLDVTSSAPVETSSEPSSPPLPPVPKPVPARRPVPTVQPPATVAAAPVTAPVVDPPPPVPQAVPAPSPVARSLPKPRPAAEPAADRGEKAIAELARRNADSTSGKFEPAVLAEKLKQLKAERFDHGKTRFALTGKHVQVKCESCHKTTLKDTPRECVACHKKDDVHRGRRNDCAACHVTSDWETIVRRR